MNTRTGLEAMSLHSLIVSNQDCGRTIRDLTCTSSRQTSAGCQCLQRANLFPVRFARAFIVLNTIEWRNLCFKAALGASLDGTHVRLDRKRFHFIA